MPQQHNLIEEDVRKLYRRLRTLLPVKPEDDQPPEHRLGPGMDLHFLTFLDIVHKYSHPLELKYRATVVGQDVIFALDGVGPPNRLNSCPSEQTFVLKLRTVFRWGVYKEQVEAFRQRFDLSDEKEFFQVLPEGRQVRKRSRH